MKSSGWLGLAALVVTGVILADVLIHPTGSKAAFNAANSYAGSTFSALLGGKSVVG